MIEETMEKIGAKVSIEEVRKREEVREKNRETVLIRSWGAKSREGRY